MNTNGTSTSASTIKVTFLHPRDQTKLPVEVGPDLTGAQALGELMGAGFIPAVGTGSKYVLQHQRTSATIPDNGSLADSGVRDGDLLSVVQVNEGHGRA